MYTDLKADNEKDRQGGLDFPEAYFLLKYLYSGDEKVLEKAEEGFDPEKWNLWHCAVLIETDKDFFDRAEENLSEEIRNELHREFFYLNLNPRQSLLLFENSYCDYVLVAKHIYVFLKQKYRERFYLSVSRKFEGYTSLPEILNQLEQQMDEKFYHRDIHIFISEEGENRITNKEIQDSQLIEKISEDVSRKDVARLWKHFSCFSEKFRNNTQFSAMYIKFVFSNVIQELFQEKRFAKEHCLDKEIDRIYSCNYISQIIGITEENIREYEEFLERSMSEYADEVLAVKNYISSHYAENPGLKALADEKHLSGGHLSFIFKKETGMSLNRYVQVFRMEKAKELLETEGSTAAQVGKELGFAGESYFIRSYREYYGSSPS